MKAIALVGIIAAVVVSTPAAAEDRGFSLGLGLGVSSYDVGDFADGYENRDGDGSADGHAGGSGSNTDGGFAFADADRQPNTFSGARYSRPGYRGGRACHVPGTAK